MVMSDIDIAQAATLVPIVRLAQEMSVVACRDVVDVDEFVVDLNLHAGTPTFNSAAIWAMIFCIPVSAPICKCVSVP